MRRLHPERIFLAVVAPLVFGGGILSAVGAVTKNRGLLKIGGWIFLVGAAISCLPLVATLIYFGCQKVSRYFRKRHNDAS
jgi:hypothetical protein